MLGYMSEKEFDSCMKQIQKDNQSKERKERLKAEKSKYKRKFKIETSKFFAFYLFIVFNVILIYAMTAMWKFGDLSYLGVLITDILAQIMLYGIYCLKAYKGKKQEEQLKFEKEKLCNFQDICEDVDYNVDYDNVDC